jgi:hypothetical protein
VSLAPLISAAHDQDLRPRRDQVGATQGRLLPSIERIMRCVARHRATVDAQFLERGAALGQAASAVAGEATLHRYPLGFCGQIRDQVFHRLNIDLEFRELIGPDTLFKKVFVLLKRRYFQNALQLGNLYLDVANDTVFVEKPKIEWAAIESVDFENADDWPTLAAVGRRYYEVDLYPNFHFPLAFPLAPYFAIRSTGRLDLFRAQSILFLKDLGDGFRRTRALLDDPPFSTRALPGVYQGLLERACGGNLREAFPLEYHPTDASGIREKILPEFEAMVRRNDSAARVTVENYLHLIETATLRLARLDLRPGIDHAAA